jgi:hypothetical protein
MGTTWSPFKRVTGLLVMSLKGLAEVYRQATRRVPHGMVSSFQGAQRPAESALYTRWPLNAASEGRPAQARIGGVAILGKACPPAIVPCLLPERDSDFINRYEALHTIAIAPAIK